MGWQLSCEKAVILADDLMPGVPELLAAWRTADGQVPNVELRRFSGRALKAADLSDADALLVRSVTRVNADLLAHSALRFVGSATIGTDHLDTSLLQQRQIPWSAAPGCNAIAVAEWVMATLLHHIPELHDDPARQCIAVVGLGQVGSRVAQRLRVWGCRVLAVDPLLDAATYPDFHWCGLDEALAIADGLCLHTPLTHSGLAPTFNLLNAERLARMKPGAFVLNAGRGEVVDEPALLRAQQAIPRPLLLDVFAQEPAINPALVQVAAQVSPHIAGHSVEGKWRGTWQVLARMAEAFQWQPIATLAESLPFAEPEALHWQLGRPWREQVAALLIAVVEPLRSDAALRQAVLETPDGQGFDHLRKHYGVRRECAAYRVLGVQAESPAQKVLQAWGFRC